MMLSGDDQNAGCRERESIECGGGTGGTINHQRVPSAVVTGVQTKTSRPN